MKVIYIFGDYYCKECWNKYGDRRKSILDVFFNESGDIAGFQCSSCCSKINFSDDIKN